jgi:Raf kinase inhibitor-like YbhB/YbcL family protein
MKIWSESFGDGDAIPTGNAFGRYDEQSHVALSENKNPHLAWSDLPPGTKSLVVVCHDPDVPSRGDDVNKEGRTVPASLPRVDFTHWVLVDLDPSAPIREGEFSSGITPRGKKGPGGGPRNTRQGVNDYTGWFAGDADMKGTYFGYDGPCPPWNDEIVHHYHFTVYAIDSARCPVEGDFTRDDVLEAIKGHVLGETAIVGTYHIYPKAR